MPRTSNSSLNFGSSFSSTASLPTPVTQRTCMSAAVKRYRYLRKLLNFNQMDFEFAFWQMAYLFISPQQVYRNFQYRKETKRQFARDDPAFLVLLSSCLCLSSVGFTIVLRLGIVAFFKLLLYFVFVDCIASGLFIATLLWFITNRYLIKPTYGGQDVEWAYTFDVHLNAFCPLLIISHIVQLFFYDIFINQDKFFPRLFGNTIWIIAIGYYFYITFLGYRHLSILQHTQIFLIPILLLFLFYIMSIIIGWNVSRSVMDFYYFRVL